MSIRAVLAIARKDLVDAIKSLYVLSALVLPILLAVLFRFAFSGLGQSLDVAVVVHDPGASSLGAALRAVPNIRVVESSSVEALPGEVERLAVAGVAIPEGFDAELRAGTRPTLLVYVNRGRAGGEFVYFDRVLDQQVRALAGQEPPAQLAVTRVGQSAATSVPGANDLDAYLLMVLLVLAVTMAGTFAVPTLLVEEKEKHTLEMILVSPARPSDVVLGKGMVGLVYCALGSLALMLLSEGWQGAWPLTVLTLLAGSAFAVLMGLLIGGIFRTSSQVNTWSSIVMLILILPTWFVSDGANTPLSTVIKLIPTYYLADALSVTLAGSPDPARLALDLAVLGVCALAAAAGVVWLIRREDR